MSDFDRFEKNMKRGMVIAFVVSCAVSAAIIYVGIHFIAKVW